MDVVFILKIHKCAEKVKYLFRYCATSCLRRSCFFFKHFTRDIDGATTTQFETETKLKRVKGGVILAIFKLLTNVLCQQLFKGKSNVSKRI